MRLVGHSGADAGYRSYTGRYPEHAFAVAVLCNAATSDPAGLAARVANIYLSAFAKPAPPPPVATTKLTTQQLSRFAGIYVNAVTGSPTWVTLKDSTLIAGRRTGPALLAVGDNRFRLANAEWEFAPNGNLVQRFLGSPSRHPVALVKRDAARPTAAELASYAGTYTSDELAATYVVTASDTALNLRTRTNKPETVTPVYGDTFAGPFLVEFTRDQGGRPSGLLISTGRARKIRFEKKP
jgi:hypothetical protein